MNELMLGDARPSMVATARLTMREIGPDDAPFIRRLLNEPSFMRFIGDRGVRTDDDARGYIARVRESSERGAGGTYLVELTADAQPLGICGLMRKPWLAAPDLAYAFVPEAGGKGYAIEAATAVMELARDTFRLTRVDAVVVPDNDRSINVLQKLGFEPNGDITDPRDGTELKLYTRRLP
jgi:ribosomal-protein-alanine N-acetyltransferase